MRSPFETQLATQQILNDDHIQWHNQWIYSSAPYPLQYVSHTYPEPYGGSSPVCPQPLPSLCPLYRFSLLYRTFVSPPSIPNARLQFSHLNEKPAIFPRGPPRKPKQSGFAIWVGNLPRDARLEDLKEFFAMEGLESVYLKRKSNCAFVNYSSQEACSKALRAFNGKCVFSSWVY